MFQCCWGRTLRKNSLKTGADTLSLKHVIRRYNLDIMNMKLRLLPHFLSVRLIILGQILLKWYKQTCLRTASCWPLLGRIEYWKALGMLIKPFRVRRSDKSNLKGGEGTFRLGLRLFQTTLIPRSYLAWGYIFQRSIDCITTCHREKLNFARHPRLQLVHTLHCITCCKWQ